MQLCIALNWMLYLVPPIAIELHPDLHILPIKCMHQRSDRAARGATTNVISIRVQVEKSVSLVRYTH